MPHETSTPQRESQGTSATSGRSTDAGGERERGIARINEARGAGGVTRRGLTSPLYGSTGSPFAIMRRMADEMDRLFEDFGFGQTGLGLGTGLGSRLSGIGSRLGIGASAWLPQVETFRRGDKLVVRADLPGLTKEDVNVEVDDGLLAISGERRAESDEERDDYYRSERSYGQFYRAIPLPDGVSADQCEASFKDGVLEVTIPAPKEAVQTAKRIPVR